MIKISVNKKILVDIFTKNIRERENYIKFMKMLQIFLKITKICKINILELFNITKLNL